MIMFHDACNNPEGRQGWIGSLAAERGRHDSSSEQVIMDALKAMDPASAAKTR